MFHSTGPHYCPQCPPAMIGRSKKRRGDPPLELMQGNYSGTGVDIARCPTCMKMFSISYKVDAIEPIK